MQNNQKWAEMLKAVKKEVLPALGCTEPISLALASAIAASHLDGEIDYIDAKVSPNLMKNGMGVTVPGTGMQGLPIAAAVGALGGNPDAGLEVLSTLTPQLVEAGKKLLEENKVSITISPKPKLLYAESTVISGEHSVKVAIADSHTNVILIQKDDQILFKAEDKTEAKEGSTYSFIGIDSHDIFEFINKVPFKEIDFILQAEKLNDALSQEGLKNSYGLHIGATLKRQMEKGFLADDLLTKVLIRSTAAADARMGGATLPAMSNSGSGNQGITATMPVVVVADFIDATPEDRARALMLSHLMAVYIHDKLPRLSALCAVTTAAMGAAAGMAWLLAKGEYEPMNRAVSSMVGDLAGMICDGAANSCAMKVSTSVGSAFKAVLMALDDTGVTGKEGIVSNNIDASIDNLCALASGSMQQVDTQVLQIMMNKQ